MERINEDFVTRKTFTNQSMVDFIIREMKSYSQVHYVKTDVNGVQFYCEFMSLNNLGMENIIKALPMCKVRIVDGLLSFDLYNYGGTFEL